MLITHANIDETCTASNAIRVDNNLIHWVDSLIRTFKAQISESVHIVIESVHNGESCRGVPVTVLV